MEKKIVSAIMLALLSIGLFNSALGFQSHERSEPEKPRPAEGLRFTDAGTHYYKKPNEEQARIVEHRITAIEIGKLKRQIGVWEEGRNCNQIIDGHGTGLRPPTDNEWAEIAGKAYLVDRILLDHTIQAPSSVDLTTQPSFPPIGHQDGEGSCTTWAVGYYMKTFQESKGWVKYEHLFDE